MTAHRAIAARAVATAVLNQFDLRRNYVGPILNKLLEQTGEKQRATDLVFGTIRNRVAIDMVITKLADCPVERIPAKALNIIRIGVYELVYSPASAEYSIVNEAVENARALMGKKQTGFVNAVLRQISRHIRNRQIPLSQGDATRILPQTLLTGCEFDSSFLPDPELSPEDYLSCAFSLPKWLVDRWLREFGSERTKKVCFASNRRPSIYIRPNSLKTGLEQFAEKLHQSDIDFEILAAESTIRVKSPQAVADLPGFEEGLFSVQDIAASRAAKALEPQSNWSILDLCAAPGAKTTQLAELTADSANIVATDVSDQRLEKVRENITRLGINSVRVIAYEDFKKSAARIGPFDAVLVDVPCSNTGVLAKRVEARYRLKAKAIEGLTRIQAGLLRQAAAMVRTGGKICYTTCSIETDENSRLVSEFLLQDPNFELQSEQLMLPSAEEVDCDGGYVAIIRCK